MVAREILQLDRQGHHHHRVFGQPVEEGEDVSPAWRSAVMCPTSGAYATLNRDDAVRQIIEPPRWPMHISDFGMVR